MAKKIKLEEKASICGFIQNVSPVKQGEQTAGILMRVSNYNEIRLTRWLALI